MTKNDRLSSFSEWIDLGFVERKRTPEWAIKEGIRLHLKRLSLSNIVAALERQGVTRSRTAVHNWVQKAGLQPTSDMSPNQTAVNETVIRVNGE